ncbi:unnamed protein product [Lasius platythorax]|uniref:Uncharacterized protein n=1 Tax=Lasius platythorax TaxID=488582 RepID=A0AAV2NQD7_9HYME
MIRLRSVVLEYQMSLKAGRNEARFANRRYRVRALSLFATEPALKCIKLASDLYSMIHEKKSVRKELL